MARKVLISLVSEQTIPNVWFIKEFKDKGFDLYVFVTTPLMQKKEKTQAILKATDIPIDKIQIIVVDEESMKDVKNKLKTLEFNNDDNIILNVTGGTKMMCLGAYEFCKEKQAEIYYKHIKFDKYRKIFPEDTDFKSFNSQISLIEYCHSYGLEIENKDKINKLVKDKEYTHSLLRKVVEEGLKLNNSFQSYINGKLNNKQEITIKNKPDLKSFLQEIIFFEDNTSEKLTKEEGVYLIGGWFEEYIYNMIRENLHINSSEIGCSIQIIGLESEKNEFDIIFLIRDKVFIIECKTSLSRGKTEDSIYKLSSLKKKFGFNAKAYLFVLSLNIDSPTYLEAIETRAKSESIKLISGNTITNPDELKKFITTEFIT